MPFKYSAYASGDDVSPSRIVLANAGEMRSASSRMVPSTAPSRSAIGFAVSNSNVREAICRTVSVSTRFCVN